MNEIKKCSLSGVGFTFEKVAYNRLNDYLNSLKEAYKESADCDEILADIEARIAELILSAQSDAQCVVTLPIIENIIAQLGSPEDISGEEKQPKAENKTRIPRRLYRDMENSKLGGVCAGLAKYFGVEAVWLRLAMASPLSNVGAVEGGEAYGQRQQGLAFLQGRDGLFDDIAALPRPRGHEHTEGLVFTQGAADGYGKAGFTAGSGLKPDVHSMPIGIGSEVGFKPVCRHEPFLPAVSQPAASFQEGKGGTPEQAVEKKERTRENRRCHISPLRPTMQQSPERCKLAKKVLS